MMMKSHRSPRSAISRGYGTLGKLLKSPSSDLHLYKNRYKAQEGGDKRTYVRIWLIRFVVQQKLTHYCEAIILQ